VVDWLSFGLSLGISSLALILSGFTFYYIYLRRKKPKMTLLGPYVNPKGSEISSYFRNEGNASTLLYPIKTSIEIGKKEYIGKFRPPPDYRLLAPSEYYLCHTNYTIGKILEDVDLKLEVNVNYEITYYDRNKFKKFKSRVLVPQKDYARFVNYMKKKDEKFREKDENKA
jgi:hypothetical protein